MPPSKTSTPFAGNIAVTSSQSRSVTGQFRRRTIYGQRGCEFRAFSELAVDGNFAAQHFRKLFAKREPKAGASIFFLRRSLGLGECLEKLGHLFGRHADATVGDRERNRAITPTLDFQPNSSIRRELAGVAEKIEK